MAKEPLDVKVYQRGIEMMRIFRTAVLKAQEESRRLGVPNVYSINGKIYFEMPDGEITQTPPEGWFDEKTD